jgi:di/tricarboxylate transporter
LLQKFRAVISCLRAKGLKNQPTASASIITQAVVAPTSEIVGSAIRDIDFLWRYGTIVVGLWRREAFLRQKLASIRLEAGDVLVLLGDEEALARVSQDRAFLMMVPFHGELQLRRKAGLAAGVMLAAIVAAVTQFIPDAATTALFAPVAVALAQAMGHTPEAYVVTVAMAAVVAFLTPIGHHGNLLVYGPGGYRFADFIRVGTPLTILAALAVTLLAPLVWPE